ncbi:MAG: hypothetical protein M1338_03840 [Patescibacteria group bacterium]|nr:hypothetical protein [Patescibacteria group bacterium]
MQEPRFEDGTSPKEDLSQPTEAKITHTPTEYYDIAENYPELKGNWTGEIINDKDGPTLHIVKEGGRRLTKQGDGDIVFLNISKEGWEKITDVISSLGPNANIKDAKRAIVEADFITWDKPSTGH